MVYIVMVDLLKFATDGRRVELQHRKIVMPDLEGAFDQMKTEKEETIKFDKNTLLWLLNKSSSNKHFQTIIIPEIEANKNNEINVKHGEKVYFKRNAKPPDSYIYKSEIIIDTGKSNQRAGYIFKTNGSVWFVIKFTNGPTISVVDGKAIVGLKDSTIHFEYITNYSTQTIQQIKIGEGTLYVRIFPNGNKEYGVHLSKKDKLVVDGINYSFGGKELTGDELEKVKTILSKDTIEDVKDAPSTKSSGNAISAAAIGIGTGLAYLYKISKKSRKTISSSRSSSRVKSSRKKRRRS